MIFPYRPLDIELSCLFVSPASHENGCSERLDLRTSSEPPFGPSLSAVRPVESLKAEGSRTPSLLVLSNGSRGECSRRKRNRGPLLEIPKLATIVPLDLIIINILILFALFLLAQQ
jgi:hypothetical protein